MSSCPFIHTTDSMDMSGSEALQTHNTSRASISSSQPIENIISDIVHRDFGLSDINIDPYAMAFRANMIHDGRLLLKLNPALVSRLNLPLLLESAIMDYIKRETPFSGKGGNGYNTRMYTQDSLTGIDHHLSRKETIATQKSALLGLTPEMKQQLKDCWNKLTNSKTGSLAKFFDEFYKNFFATDKIGKRLFEGASMANQAQALMKMLKFIISSIDNPLNLLAPLQKLGVRHLIYGVEKKSFSAFGVALARTFESILGPEEVTSEMKEAWYILIMKLGEVMMAEYEGARKGWKGMLYCRSKSKGNNQWKLRPTLLTHDRLVIFRGQDYSKVQEELYLNIIDDIDIVEEGTSIGSGESSQYCLSISTAATIIYFRASNEEDFEKWVDELTARIRAHQRVNLSDDSDSSVEERKNRLASQEKTVKRLKQGLQQRKRKSGSRAE